MQQETPVTTSSKTYYLDGEYWRSSLYLVIGAVIIISVTPFVPQWQGRGWADWVVVGIVCGALTIFGISLLLPRLRIDAEGIHRRLFFWYWDSWMWEEFRSGEIREGMSLNSYRGLSRPFWRREIALEFYPSAVRVAIEKVLKQFTLQSRIENPESISLKLFSERWEFRKAGITLKKKKTSRSHGWKDIESISVTKLTHEHHSFRKLKVMFAEKTLTLRVRSDNGQRFENWEGAQPEEILAYLMKETPEDRIEVTATHGPPQTKSEATRRLEKLSEHRQSLKVLHVIMTLASVCMLMLGIFDQRIGFLIYSIFMTVVCYGVGLVMIRTIKQRLEHQRKEIDDWLRSKGYSERLNLS